MQRSEVFKATAGSCRVVADTRATYQQAAIESAPRDAFVSPTVLLTLSVTILHPPRAHRRRARAAADNEAYDAQELERDTLEAGPRVEALSASELGPSGIVRAIKVYIEHNAAALCLRPSVELVQDEPGDVSALRRQGCDKARAVTLKLSSAAPQWASDTTQSFLTSADTHITWNGPRRRRPDRGERAT
ncbi:hypothetical protein IE81DRAFT_166106 [Ceraceosorus guamensis]|uniref:Uncharacterized protein n=1 Tax=Ceraceosorus guamensis TaxID=1522189 RepID=A0A316W9E0_9BASI|nr:hypothetical protein IE81DRAFT_166106 [Ceraceosorus guamensis]PWN45688.1 hypothetical protein IE81DRAFT_166106 [Ceraceosorus guamensis]